MKNPAGTVVLAGHRRGIHWSNSPGGWQIIGQWGYYCLANVHRDDLDALTQLKSGDSVAFQFEG